MTGWLSQRLGGADYSIFDFGMSPAAADEAFIDQAEIDPQLTSRAGHRDHSGATVLPPNIG